MQKRCHIHARSGSCSTNAQVYENIAGHKPNPAMIIVLCGIAKLFVGDLTEAGKESALTVSALA